MYPTLTDWQTANNNTGIEGLFLYASSTVSLFIPLMLFALFTIILLATFFSQKRLTGRGDFPASMVAASFITLIGAVLLSLVAGLIATYIVVVCIAILIISVIILLVTRE